MLRYYYLSSLLPVFSGACWHFWPKWALYYRWFEHKLKNVAISFQIHDNRELFLINSVANHFKTPVLQSSKGYQVFTQMKHFHNKFERYYCIWKIRGKLLRAIEAINKTTIFAKKSKIRLSNNSNYTRFFTIITRNKVILNCG